MSIMKAAVLGRYGTPLRVTDVLRPQPGRGEILVRIAASGVNPIDTKIFDGAAAHARHTPRAMLGLDRAGTIEAVGPGVARYREGDEVYGMTGGVGGHQGSLAEFAAVDADVVALKPANLSMREAAAVSLACITGWEGLVDQAAVAAGWKLLVHGGVGHLVIQIARAFGAEVFATDLEPKRADIEHLSATFVAARRFGHVVSSLGWGTHALAPLSFRAATSSGVFTLLPLLTGRSCGLASTER